MTLAYAPRQHLVEVDDQVERQFTEALSELKDAGACGAWEHVKRTWTRSVIPSSADYVSHETYWAALKANRQERRRRYSSTVFSEADALLFPTTPCAAPLIETQWRFRVSGKEVADVFLSRHTHPASAAGLPGITVPMGLNSEGLPLGLELDGAEGRDRDLPTLARAVEAVLNRVPAPRGF
jgi:Asp-tRNA(Asn)/Glu-tRNA(Gln) amidotransferase A subunit family amidase